ncbi:retrovirus-related pol polyprotein from transposon TNT 1-94 [Tanacetum coccineum]
MTYSHSVKGNWGTTDHPLKNMEDIGIFDSGCSWHMTSNKDHLDDFEEYKGGSVTFGGSKGYITGKGRIRVGNLDFDSVSFVKELGHFNLFSISQICDKQHKVLFTKTKCLVVSPDFKMPNENQILLKVPRKHNMYSFDMKTPSLTKDYACLIAKATYDESKLWHKRLGHINFKNLNKLVKGNLVRGLSSKLGIINMATKDETSCILQNFIRQIRNQLNHRVKIIRSDNGTEFNNRDMLEFCGNKGIKQEYSNAKTLQQNGVAERMNMTHSLLPTTFWAEAVSIACYIFNKVRVTTPQNKTPYELLFSHKIRPFGCHVTILDTLSMLGKFDGKCDEGFLVGYSLDSKAFRVYNLVTKKVEVNLHVKFLEEKPNVKDSTSKVTNSIGTLQTPNANASKEEDEAEGYWIFDRSFKNLQAQEKEAYSTGISEDTPEILAFRRELDELAQKHLREVPKNKATSFAPVARIEAIRKVYKVVKALYGLHQATRAWYATLSTFLEKHGYRRGTIDKTLFIKKVKKDIMLVQVYVDDIIFGSTRKSWCDEFEALMKGRFQMSSIGELIFFLGLQVKQKTDRIFISQDKYVVDMLKKFNLTSVKTVITPMETNMALTKDEEADEVDVHLYRSMIESSFDRKLSSDSDYLVQTWTGNLQLVGVNFLGSN